MFVDKGYQEHEEFNKDCELQQKFPIYGKALFELFWQKFKVRKQLKFNTFLQF